MRQGDGGDDSRDEFKHESEWGDATLSSSRHAVYDSGGSHEVDRCELMSLQKELRWEKLEPVWTPCMFLAENEISRNDLEGRRAESE